MFFYFYLNVLFSGMRKRFQIQITQSIGGCIFYYQNSDVYFTSRGIILDFRWGFMFNVVLVYSLNYKNYVFGLMLLREFFFRFAKIVTFFVVVM